MAGFAEVLEGLGQASTIHSKSKAAVRGQSQVCVAALGMRVRIPSLLESMF